VSDCEELVGVTQRGWCGSHPVKKPSNHIQNCPSM